MNTSLKELMELMNKADWKEFEKFYNCVHNRELLYCPGHFHVDNVKYTIRYDKFDSVLLVFNTTNGDTIFNGKVDTLMVCILIRNIRLRRVSNTSQEYFMLCGHPVMFDDTTDMIKLHGIMGDFPINICFGHGKDVKEIITITKETIEVIKLARKESGR